MRVEFISAKNPVLRVKPELQRALAEAQRSTLERSFNMAGDLVRVACRRSGLPDVAETLNDTPLLPFADLPHAHLAAQLRQIPAASGLSDSAIIMLCDNIQLFRAFVNPDAVVEAVRAKVEKVVDRFPRRIEQLERGKNPGDVMDPFVLGATQILLCGGSIEQGIEASVVHKSMMMLEDLIGNLHQDVIGEMRGNVRILEPQGEDWDLMKNPFPGADIAQPPLCDGDRLRFFQVKNKTGSAKGGDGVRLGLQFKQLMDRFGAEVHYVSILGTTLKGHRSRAGVLRVCPGAVVAVGETALRHLTRSKIGGELLLRVYQSAFRDVARAREYSVREVAALIAAEFRRKLDTSDEKILDGIIRDVTQGGREQQDSRFYKSQRLATTKRTST